MNMSSSSSGYSESDDTPNEVQFEGMNDHSEGSQLSGQGRETSSDSEDEKSDTYNGEEEEEGEIEGEVSNIILSVTPLPNNCGDSVSSHEEDFDDNGGVKDINVEPVERLDEIFRIDVSDLEERVLNEANEDELLKDWSAKCNPFICCWKYPQILKNIMFIFYMQIRVRYKYLIVYTAFTLREPVFGISLIILGSIFVILDALFYTLVISIIHCSDMHSTFRILLRYELIRHNRCYKFLIYFTLTMTTMVSMTSYVALTAWQDERVSDSLFFRFCYGEKGDPYYCNCEPGPLYEVGNDTNLFTRYYEFTKDSAEDTYNTVYSIIFIALINGFFTFVSHLWSIMNYEGPASQRMNSQLGWPLNTTRTPELNIGCCDILLSPWTGSEVMLRNIHQMIFFVESDEDVRRISKLPSFSHLRWKYLKGLSTSDIIFLRNIFYNFKDEHEEGRFDHCCYRNEKCCCLRTFCSLYCKLCCCCACLYSRWGIKVLSWALSFTEGEEEKKLKKYKRDEVKATILKNLELIRGKQKSLLMTSMRQTKCKELIQLVAIRRKALLYKILAMYRRMKETTVWGDTFTRRCSWASS